MNITLLPFNLSLRKPRFFAICTLAAAASVVQAPTDTDHFNRDFTPEKSRGGVAICRLDPGSGVVTPRTGGTPGIWDFRASESPDGRLVVFCRAKTGDVPGIWVMEADGRNLRSLTGGLEGKGADQPRWLPSANPYEIQIDASNRSPHAPAAWPPRDLSVQ